MKGRQITECVKSLVAIFVFSNALGLCFASPKLVVTSDESAVLDSPLHFYATLKNPEKDEYTISWQENWPYERDKVEPLTKSNNFSSNWTVTYWSKDHYQGRFAITVTVFYKFFGIWVNVATEIAYYTITSNFTGTLDIKQGGAKVHDNLISTCNETDLVANVHDPSDFLRTADNVTYSWFNSTGFIMNTTENVLRHNYTREGDYYVNVTLNALFNASNPNTTALKTGFFETNITAKVPVLNFTVSGPTWFPHGRLLDLNVSCEGSGPYSYCWLIKAGSYNRTGNETCEMPSVTNACEFPITRYFSQPGHYNLLVIISNDVSTVVNQSSVFVYKVHQKQQLSIIVVPVTCSIIAIVLIIFGIAYYLEHQVKLNVEVADFDFGQEHEMPRPTFFQRLKNAMYTNNAGGSNSLLVPSLSDDEPSITSE